MRTAHHRRMNAAPGNHGAQRQQTWAFNLALEIAYALYPLARAADYSQERVNLGPAQVDAK